MDAGWSPEAFKVCRLREDKEARDVVREDSKFVADLKDRVDKSLRGGLNFVALDS
jgi:hypothetical protein